MRSRTIAAATVAALSAFALPFGCVSLDGVAGGAAAADAADAGADGDGDALPESTPGLVACGPSQCSVPSSHCCVAPPPTASEPLDQRCRPAADICPRHVIACDEKSDCPSGEYCCVGLGDGGEYRATCARLCGAVQACKTDGECLGGKTCKELTCLGQRIWACSPSPVCSAN